MAEETVAVETAAPASSSPTPDATPSSGSNAGENGSAPWEYNPSYLDNGGAQGGGTQPPLAPSTGQPAATPGTPATQDAKNAMQAPNAPVPVVHPVRRSGLAGIVDEIRDAIAGKTQTNIGTDAQGNKYLKTTDLTGGQKWARIASTALHGAAAGWANGQGPGGAARALQAGVNVADKQSEAQKNLTKEQKEEVKQDQLDKFNMIKLKHDVAASAFALTRMQVKASQDDITFAQQQNEHERTLGSADLGIFKDPAELASVQQKEPQFWKNVYSNNVVTVPEIDPTTGKRNGIHVYLRTPGVGSQLAPKGTPIMDYVPGEKPTDPPKLVSRVPTIPMTHDQVDQYNNASHAKYAAWQTQQEDLKDKQAQEELRKSEAGKNKAEANKANAEAGKANAEAKVLNSAASADSVNSNAAQLVEGTMDIANLSKRSKTYDATLQAANAYSLQKYGVPFNAAKAAGDYKFATNPQTYNTLNYLNSLTGRDNQGGNLGVVVEMSRKLPRTQFPPLNAVDQWAKLSAGNPQVAAYRAALVEVDDQIAKILQGGGQGGGGTSDAKLKQAAELLNKNFTAEQITAVAQNTLRPLLANRKNEIIGDNRYLQQWHGAQRPPQANPNALAGPVRQGEQSASGPGGHQIVARGGKWVDPQTGQEVK